MLKMKDVSKVFRTAMVETHALRNLNLEVRAGEFLAVTGPSGSGKTTFLNIAGLLEELTSGEYLLDGVDVKSLDDKARSKLRNEKLGFVFQSFNLIPDLDLFDNVDVPLRYRGFSRSERKKRIESALERVGLASRTKHFPAELSGGQQQRVAIARAIALEPKIMLFDEPTSALDPELVGSVLNVMQDLKKNGMTMVVVSHEMRFARQAADRVIFIDHGLIVEQGPPSQIFQAPRSERLRTFLAEVMH
jgi:putative ABC transport system ATP-binding protein